MLKLMSDRDAPATQEMVADAGRQALQFEAKAEDAQAERDHQEAARAAFAEYAAQARFIRDYMRSRIGRTLASIAEEARAAGPKPRRRQQAPGCTNSANANATCSATSASLRN